MKEEFSEELVSWAEEVITECKTIAENYHLDYYAFQKPCNLNYKYLILYNNNLHLYQLSALPWTESAVFCLQPDPF